MLSCISSRIIPTTDYNDFASSEDALVVVGHPHSHFMVDMRSLCLEPFFMLRVICLLEMKIVIMHCLQHTT